MGLKKEIRGEIAAIKQMLMGISKRLEDTRMVNEQLEAMNAKLMAERKELLDRIMSVNYEKFQLYHQSEQGFTPPPGLGMDQLEDMAGEAFALGEGSDET